MKFVLTISLKKKYREFNERAVKVLLSIKQRQIEGHRQRRVNVLVTDDHRTATRHNDAVDTLTLMVTTEVIRVYDGIVASHPEDIGRNLQMMLDRFHLVG